MTRWTTPKGRGAPTTRRTAWPRASPEHPAAGRACRDNAPGGVLWACRRVRSRAGADRRRPQALVVGMAKDGAYMASDIIAMIDHTRRMHHGRRRLRRAVAASITFFEPSGDGFVQAHPEYTHIDWDADLTEKGGYPRLHAEGISGRARHKGHACRKARGSGYHPMTSSRCRARS